MTINLVWQFKCLKVVFVLMEARAYNNLLLLYRKQYLHESQRKTLRLSFVNPRKGRSSHTQIFFKLGALKNFANFTGKHLSFKESLKQIPRQAKFCKFF